MPECADKEQLCRLVIKTSAEVILIKGLPLPFVISLPFVIWPPSQLRTRVEVDLHDTSVDLCGSNSGLCHGCESSFGIRGLMNKRVRIF